MRRILSVFALIAAASVIMACSSGGKSYQQGGSAKPAPQAGSGQGGAPSCGGAGKA